MATHVELSIRPFTRYAINIYEREVPDNPTGPESIQSLKASSSTGGIFDSYGAAHDMLQRLQSTYDTEVLFEPRKPHETEVGPVQSVLMLYTNYKGETEERRVQPRAVYWGWTEWHPDPCYLLHAFDLEKNAIRDFELEKCQFLPEGHVLGSRAVSDVLRERARQVSSELFDEQHDRQYSNYELERAAIRYAGANVTYPSPQEQADTAKLRESGDPEADPEIEVDWNKTKAVWADSKPPVPQGWPWPASWWKPKSHRRNLVKAAALILAAIDLLDQRTSKKPKNSV